MDSDVTLMRGDCRKVLPLVADESVDAIVTDPPYELGFNGEKWDSTGIAYDAEMWRQVLRAAKPGAYLLAFGGTRTFHRMTAAIEDAGFVIDDCLAWLYGNGFPKHRSKLKPAWEPCILARKRDAKATLLNIDDCRDNGRWPANVVLDPEAAALLDQYGKGREPLSRIYYVAKATTAEREAGLSRSAGLRRRQINLLAGLKPKAHARFNDHPTVKPIELMRRLVRLITPDGGVVLDPFTGSGTTGCAAALEGRAFVGIEREPRYFRLAESRIRYWKELATGAN